MRQSACLVLDLITVNNFASLFNCTPVGRPRHKAIYFCLVGAGAFLSVAGPTGVQVLVFFCSSVPLVLFDTPVFSGSPQCRSQHIVSVESSSLFHRSIYP